jgi:hypothetical protein
LRDELVRQHADDPAADDHVTNGIERSLPIDRIDQNLERLEERFVPKIAHSHLALCLGENAVYRDGAATDS